MFILIYFIVAVIGVICYLDLKTYGKYNKYGGKKAIASHRGIPPFGVGLDFIVGSSEGESSSVCIDEILFHTRNWLRGVSLQKRAFSAEIRIS